MKLEIGPTLVLLAGFALVFHAADGRADAPTGRFIKSTGLVTDSKTGLIWQQPASSATYTFIAAYSYCAEQGTGWRVPTGKELLTLVDTTTLSEQLVIDTAVFSGTQVDKDWWSSTSVSVGSARAWAVDFRAAGLQGEDTATPLYVRCVK